MDSIDAYLNRLRADVKYLCNPHLERRVARQDAYLEHVREITKLAGEDIGTLQIIIEDIDPQFWQEFMEAFRLYGSQHLTTEKMTECLTGMLEAYDSDVAKYAEHEWEKSE